ncbi:MAG TPA: hypothetical protein VFD01_08050 [Candidatus Dormibacteraeota bacterium]|jgi:hypothetical protein|nr:hypothetical protein [Candidatus Dormibacteraeota bacterium]
MRITPVDTQIDHLTDWEPYLAQVREWALVDGAPQYGGEPRLQVTLALEDGSTLKDWMSLRLGQRQGGGVSKLRSFLNALARRPESTRIEWFDTEDLSWSYDGRTAHGRLQQGQWVILRGRREERPDGEGARFRVITYQPAPTPAPRPTTQVAATPATVAPPAVTPSRSEFEPPSQVGQLEDDSIPF